MLVRGKRTSKMQGRVCQTTPPRQCSATMEGFVKHATGAEGCALSSGVGNQFHSLLRGGKAFQVTRCAWFSGFKDLGPRGA